MPKLLVIAIGGNSLIKDSRYQRVEDQYAAICETARPIVGLIEDGYRRAVPSPMPVRIVELDAIETLINQGFCVIAIGGGGIPVIRLDDGALEGRDAVIDKDHASSLLATQLKADILLISTAVENVFKDYGKANQKALDAISAKEAKRLMAEGHFAAGSMQPKINAALDFIEHGGESAIITSPQYLKAAIEGEAGTRICR